MDGVEIEAESSLQAYPNLTTAAALLGVAPSTLSRREDLRAVPRGERDRVIRPADVMYLATTYRRRSLNDVAQALIEHARKVASPTEAARVEEEIERFFDDRVSRKHDIGAFLEQARQLLPAALLAEVERVVSARNDDEPELPDALIGWHPIPDD